MAMLNNRRVFVKFPYMDHFNPENHDFLEEMWSSNPLFGGVYVRWKGGSFFQGLSIAFWFFVAVKAKFQVKSVSSWLQLPNAKLSHC